MEFGNEKCAMLLMKSGKRKTTEEIVLPNYESIKTLGEKEITSTWKYWMSTPSNKQKLKKNKKRQTQKNEKASQNQALQQKSHQRKKHLASPPDKML